MSSPACLAGHSAHDPSRWRAGARGPRPSEESPGLGPAARRHRTDITLPSVDELPSTTGRRQRSRLQHDDSARGLGATDVRRTSPRRRRSQQGVRTCATLGTADHELKYATSGSRTCSGAPQHGDQLLLADDTKVYFFSSRACTLIPSVTVESRYRQVSNFHTLAIGTRSGSSLSSNFVRDLKLNERTSAELFEELANCCNGKMPLNVESLLKQSVNC